MHEVRVDFTVSSISPGITVRIRAVNILTFWSDGCGCYTAIFTCRKAHTAIHQYVYTCLRSLLCTYHVTRSSKNCKTVLIIQLNYPIGTKISQKFKSCYFSCDRFAKLKFRYLRDILQTFQLKLVISLNFKNQNLLISKLNITKLSHFAKLNYM